MKAICTNNSDHDQFITVAHVSQEWVVDREGNFIEQYGCEGETVAKPDRGNEWTCKICGSEATVE